MLDSLFAAKELRVVALNAVYVDLALIVRIGVVDGYERDRDQLFFLEWLQRWKLFLVGDPIEFRRVGDVDGFARPSDSPGSST